MANVGLTLCFQVDTMMNKYMESLEKTFVTQGGIKERMHSARTGYRQQQDLRLAELEKAVPALQQQLAQAQAEAADWKSRYEDLKQRALNAYHQQKEEIERLKESNKDEQEEWLSFGSALKPKEENMSDYCRNAALAAFTDLVSHIKSRYLVVSYNNTYHSKSSSSENKIKLEQLEEVLNKCGNTQVFNHEFKAFNSGKT